MGFFAGALLVLLDVQLPPFLDKTLKYIGDMAVAFGVIYVGIMLHDVGLSHIHLDKDIALVFAGRYIVSPVVVVALSFLIPVPDEMLKVFIIQASLPVMLNIAVMAGYYRADVRYGTLLTSVTTLLSLITVPGMALLVSFFIP